MGVKLEVFLFQRMEGGMSQTGLIFSGYGVKFWVKSAKRNVKCFIDQGCLVFVSKLLPNFIFVSTSTQECIPSLQ